MIAADPFEITAIISLTGQSAFLGKEEAETFALIEAGVNKTGGIGGRPLKFTIVDDQSSPQIGVQLATLAIARKDASFSGPSLTRSAAARSHRSLKTVPLIGASPSTHPVAGGFVFGAPPTTDAQVAAIRYFREKGWKRIAIIVATDASAGKMRRSSCSPLSRCRRTRR